MQEEKNLKLLENLIPLSKWNDYYQFPTVGALRQYVFRAETNGFNKVITRIGKKIYIKVDELKNWIENGAG